MNLDINLIGGIMTIVFMVGSMVYGIYKFKEGDKILFPEKFAEKK
ncbi:MAG: hypothetical protein OSJ27_01650 [Candidatus Gastranaerophilales bacterium]|nr:hypothetical protein [Candidatus Gastranaerophilales bacterium]